MRWTRNVTSIICCRNACCAWSKLVKPPDIYGTHETVTKKGTFLIKNITSEKSHFTTYTANLHIGIIIAIYWFSKIPEAK